MVFRVKRLNNSSLLRIRTTALVTSALAVSVFGAGCAAKSPGSGSLLKSVFNEETARAAGLDTSISEESLARYYFMRGQLELDSERFDSALKNFKEAAKYEKGEAPILRKSLAEMYLRNSNLEAALAELNAIGAAGKTDPEFLELRAGILATLKQIPEAIADYRTLIALTPERPNEDAYVLLASLYAENGDLPAAKNTLKELIGRAPKSVFAHYYLARVYEASGEFKDAERLYRSAMKLNPNAEAVQMDLARSLGAQKRFKEGSAVAEDLIKQNPNNMAARQLLAQLLLGDNRVDEALTAFEDLGKLQNDPTDTRFKIALIKLERRDFKGAENELNLILAKSPENETARYYLALAYSGLERVEDALTELKKVSKDHKLFLESRILASYLLRQQKRYDAAIAEIELALEKNPSDIRLLGFLGSLQRDGEKTEGAVQTLQRLITLEPNDDQHHFSLGVFLDEIGKKDEAILAMRKAVALNPKNANALNYLGYTFADLGTNLDEAVELIKRAIQIEPKNGYFVDSLGWVYFKMHRLTEAKKELERAVTLTPNDAVILEHFAIILQALGEKGRAIETAKRALSFAPASDDKDVERRLKKLIQDLGSQ